MVRDPPPFHRTARGRHPPPASLDRLAHEFALRDELDEAWAVQPRELRREHGRMLLVLENPGGEPLARLLDAPVETSALLYAHCDEQRPRSDEQSDA